MPPSPLPLSAPPAIVSASRRTDIPACFTPWFLRRLREGFCEVVNPFNRNQRRRVELGHGSVTGFVLWTKNLGPLLDHLDTVRERAPFYVQFTITGHGAPLEPHVPPWEHTVTQARELARRHGPDALVWRFDPIVHTPQITAERILERFERLATALDGATGTCVISFMAPYRRQARAFAAAGVEGLQPSARGREELVIGLTQTAREHGMSLAGCCTPDLPAGLLAPATCIDPRRLVSLGASLTEPVPPAPSRPGCHCARCEDIGAYDLCGGGCLYCYANRAHALARARQAAHDPSHLALDDARPAS